MSSVIDRSTIEKLSVEERLKLIDLIWETLRTQDAQHPMSDGLRAEFARRLEDARANPDEGMSPDEFAERLRASRA